MNKKNIYNSIFFDLGGVLFYDEYVHLFYYYCIFKLINKHLSTITIETFFKNREHFYQKFLNNWVRVYLKKFNKNDIAEFIIHKSWVAVIENFKMLFRPYPHAKDLLFDLQYRFNLCCVANQPAIVNDLLDELDFKKNFKLVILDSLVGFSKPDTRIFELGLKELKVQPLEVIHIGDRYDNDILPALELGITPIHLSLPTKEIYIDGIDRLFCKQFYEALSQFWFRSVEIKSVSCIKVKSYDELMHQIYKIS